MTKKYGKGEKSKAIINYAKDKADTKEPWFCTHELADFFGWTIQQASDTLTSIVREGEEKGCKIIDRLFNKSTCKWQKTRNHFLYTFMKEKKKEPKPEKTEEPIHIEYPVKEATLKRIEKFGKTLADEPFDLTINRILDEAEKKPEKVVEQPIRLDDEIREHLTTIVKEYGQVKTALDKQKRINKVLIEYL